MAKCLVTGASGFIGTHLVPALVKRGDKVTCLVRRTSKLTALEGLPISLAQGDVTSAESLPAAMVDCDVVYHLAGLTKALRYNDLLRVNAGGIENLMHAAAARPTPPVVVFVSSLAVAGPAVDDRPREPHESPQPVSNYGQSKLAGEIAATKLADHVPLTILRPPIVIGEGDLLTLDLFHAVSAFRIHLLPGTRPTRFSAVHAADLVKAMILAAERGARVTRKESEVIFAEHTQCNGNGSGTKPTPAPVAGQGIYYPADTEMPTFADFGRLIARGLGRERLLIIPVPKTGTRLVGLLGELAGQILRKPLPLNRDKAREAVAGSWICSPRTANEELGFQPGAPLADRFRQTVQWYRNEGWI